MPKRQEEKNHQETLKIRITTVTKSWAKIEENLEMFRKKIEDDYFERHPDKIQLFRKGKEEDTEEVVRKKLYKHSIAVINCMEMIVDFFDGNEESKPIFFLLGKQHKQIYINKNLFLELKDSICRVITEHLGEETSKSWETVLQYIYVNYVFPGMEMIQVI